MNRADPETLAAWLGLEAVRSLLALDTVAWSAQMQHDLRQNAYAMAVAAGHYGALAQGPINPVSAADPMYQMRWGAHGWESGRE